ncbi:hypothetical protein FRB99_005611 [Tulasnella sp. 403]|nr:hypothetical protein FRB99_005611 [Tulasnella sp. 403]
MSSPLVALSAPAPSARLRHDHERTLPLYALPVDGAEHTRLELQHELIIQQAGLYYRPDIVEKNLAPRLEGSPPPTVLDIGTGPGIWAIEMAKRFPYVQVVGVDLAPPNPNHEVPPNCRFECRDVNNGLKDLKERHSMLSIFIAYASG